MSGGKKAAKLWEETLVISLRDTQWQVEANRSFKLYANDIAKLANTLKKRGESLGIDEIGRVSRSALPRFATPPGFIKLDGSAESATADVALASSKGLCFLIEVKSGRDCARDEWKVQKKRKKPLKDGGVAAKAAYTAIRRMVDSFNANPSNVDLLASSFRCHQLAYWEIDQQIKGGAVGKLFIEPYIHACMKARRPHEIGLAHTMPQPVGFEYHFGTTQGKKPDYSRMSADSMLKTEFQMSYRYKESQEQAPKFIDSSFGLEYPDFQTYIDWLCSECTTGEGGVQPINCIVMTTDGFFQAISDTSELSWLLKLSSRPKPKPKLGAGLRRG